MKLNLSSRQRFFIGLFLVLAAYAVFSRLLDGVLLKAFAAALKGSGAIFGGFVLAFLLNPILNRLQRCRVFNIFSRCRHYKKIVRCISIIFLYIMVMGISALVLAFIIPSIYMNIVELVKNLPDYFVAMNKWISDQMSQHTWLQKLGFTNFVSGYIDKIIAEVTGNAEQYIKLAYTFIRGTGLFLFNTVMAFLVAYYLLYDKEKFSQWFKKLWQAILNNDYMYAKSLEFLKDANKVSATTS
ncbi:MAG TPA: AI-2E family transporter [Clostridia bacterium]|nr:AI-2E family transporter [Clostridia bacterium]